MKIFYKLVERKIKKIYFFKKITLGIAKPVNFKTYSIDFIDLNFQFIFIF